RLGTPAPGSVCDRAPTWLIAAFPDWSHRPVSRPAECGIMVTVPNDRTGDKLMRSLPQSQNRGRPAHLPLFAAITNDPLIMPTPSQLPQKCSPRCRKFPLDTNAPDKWVQPHPDFAPQPL